MSTRDLAVYAAIVGTASGLWSIVWSVYTGLWRDRARIKLVVYESEAWDEGFTHAEDAVTFAISNRGRRPIELSDFVRIKSGVTGVREASMLLQRKIREEGGTISADNGRSYHVGGYGDYTHGDIRLKRWCAVDKAGRVYPLRERYRQRVEHFIFWPIRRVRASLDKRDRDPSALDGTDVL